MKLTKDQEKSLYAWCMKTGLDISYGKLSLCDLRNHRHSQINHNRRFQVHSTDQNCPWSMIYEDIEPAINKFMELKTKVKLNW